MTAFGLLTADAPYSPMANSSDAVDRELIRNSLDSIADAGRHINDSIDRINESKDVLARVPLTK